MENFVHQDKEFDLFLKALECQGKFSKQQRNMIWFLYF